MDQSFQRCTQCRNRGLPSLPCIHHHAHWVTFTNDKKYFSDVITHHLYDIGDELRSQNQQTLQGLFSKM